MAINNTLLTQAETIRDESNVGANTAPRVGSLLVSIINEFSHYLTDDEIAHAMATALGQYYTQSQINAMLNDVVGNGSIVNANDGKTYRLWIGTQAQLTALGGNYSDDVIYMTGTEVNGSVDVQLTGITISRVSSTANRVQYLAKLWPSNTTETDVVWSISDTTYASLSSSGLTAFVTAKAGANNASVVVTCRSTIRNSVYSSDTVALTFEQQSSDTITNIADISMSRTAPNTMSVIATADGTIPAITYTITSVSKVKNVDRTGGTPSVVDVDACTINGNTLTYKADCTVEITATAGNISYAKSFNITHADSDYIYFEDDVVENILMENGIGTSGVGITYAEAAATTSVRMVAGDDSVVRFKEFMYFGVTTMGSSASSGANFIGCSALECIGLPSTLTHVIATGAAYNPFYGCVLEEVHATSIADYCNIFFGSSTTTASAYPSWINAGAGSGGIGLYVGGSEVTSLVVPSSVTNVNGYAFAGLTHLTGAEFEGETTLTGSFTFSGCTSLATVIIGHEITDLPSAAFRDLTSLATVDIGSGMSALSSQLFRGCTGLTDLTLRYDGVVTSDNSFYNTSLSNITLHVPSNQVAAYQADATWSGAASITAIS